MATPLITLDRGAPIQAQLYARIRAAIAEGTLAPGERLPSARSLAAQLGIARGTVDAAYARLAGEGSVQGNGPAGTIVTPNLRPPRPVQPLPAPAAPAPPAPFAMGQPALDMFPRTLWARLATSAVRRLGPASLVNPDPAGLPALREAVAAYLAIARGVACQPAQVIVTGGYQAALDLAARLLLRPGDPVWIEDPGYAFARAALVAAQAQLVPVPVDGEGMDVPAAIAAAPRARLAVVTPTHQSPLGIPLSPARRRALLDWAETAGAHIVEDDYDSEFHYSGRRPPALAGQDGAGRVLLAGSFSKTLFPALRLGYLVVPPHLAAAAQTAAAVQHGVPTFGQQITATFLAEGYFARHLRRMRSLYAARRSALAAALAAEFGPALRMLPRAGGLHLIAALPPDCPDTAACFLGAKPLSAQSIAHPAGNALLLGFTNIPERDAPAHAAALRQAMGWQRGRAGDHDVPPSPRNDVRKSSRHAAPPHA